MSGLGMQILKVPKVIMSRLRLRHFVVRLWLSGMNNIWELYSILNEKDGNVVSDKIPVSFLSVELCCESTHITDGIGRTAGAENG
jgi:hypothetical protein